ncbi:hypothetical protein pipiens_013103 [Culex pipiens pipiens]|uniref:Uncharacterized protein n=1 Tax=Culex pipiens pipiens TaxID=38569 RepID=A0ABD1CZZ3_CULPP
MARFMALFTILLLLTVALVSCSKTEKYCKHIRCTVVDKDCTRPLKTHAYCSCHMKGGKLKKAYGTCPSKTVFNGETDRCETDSRAARAFCKRQ